MNKIQKIIAGSALSLIMAVSSITGVSAATSLGYSATVNTGGKKLEVTTTTPSANYNWALNYLTSIEGGRVTSMYHTLYGTGLYDAAGPEITFFNNYDGKSAIWFPSGINTLPAFFGNNSIPGECYGSRTNSSYCALSGYKYRLYLKNTSSTVTTVSGQFTLTEH